MCEAVRKQQELMRYGDRYLKGKITLDELQEAEQRLRPNYSQLARRPERNQRAASRRRRLRRLLRRD